MVKIKEKDIKEVMKIYEINNQVENINFLCEIYNEKENRVRVICQVSLKNNRKYIVKFVQEKEYPYELMEEQSIFSEALRKSGINTAKVLKCGEEYCYSYKLENLNLVVTVQEYLGNAIEVINKKLVKEIAKLMANMHKVSEDKNCHIHNDTIWSLWKYDSDIMRGYVDTYRSIRKLNIFEIRAMNDIYAVVVPFWWSRIIFEEEGSLIYIVKKKDRRNLREFLNETYRMLGLKYFN